MTRSDVAISREEASRLMTRVGVAWFLCSDKKILNSAVRPVRFF